MTETQMVRDTRIRPAQAEAETTSRPDHPRRPRRRPGQVIARLRGLLQAQALLNGTIGGPYDVAFIEDDRGRLAGRRGDPR